MSSVPPVNFNLSEDSGVLVDLQSEKREQINKKLTELLGHWIVSELKIGTLNKVSMKVKLPYQDGAFTLLVEDGKIKVEEVHRVVQAIKTEGVIPSSSSDPLDSANHNDDVLGRREHDEKTHKVAKELLQLLEDVHPHLNTAGTTQEVPNALADDLSSAFDIETIDQMCAWDDAHLLACASGEWTRRAAGEAVAGAADSTNKSTVRAKHFPWTQELRMKLVKGFLEIREEALKNESKKQPSDVAILKKLKKNSHLAFPTAEIMRNQLNNIVIKYLEKFKVNKELTEVKADVEELKKIFVVLESGELYPTKKCKKCLSGRVKK